MVAEASWVGLAAVIAAIGSATSAIITALNGRTSRRIEHKLDEANGKEHR